MSQRDAIEALGLLLRDRALRKRFASDQSAVVKELGVASDQATFLCELNVQQLDAQARSLIRKRQAEVARLVPETWLRLGPEAHLQFRQYADQSPWPEGHRRHVIDADRFCTFLQNRGAPEHLKSEHHPVAFLAGNRPFSVKILTDLMVGEKERWAIQFCLRRKGFVTYKAFHFRSISQFLVRNSVG